MGSGLRAGELAEVLVARTISNRSALRRLVHQARRAGRLAADAAGTSAVVKSKGQLGEEVEIAFQPGLPSRDPERYLDYALELPARIAAADRKQVVVFFDEFQEVASAQQPYGDPDRLTKRMRAIFQRSADVSYLFAGSIEHMMRDLFHTPSPLRPRSPHRLSVAPTWVKHAPTSAHHRFGRQRRGTTEGPSVQRAASIGVPGGSAPPGSSCSV